MVIGTVQAMQAVALVETTLDSMDFKDDVAVVVDQALPSILQSLSQGTPKVSTGCCLLLIKCRPIW